MNERAILGDGVEGGRSLPSDVTRRGTEVAETLPEKTYY